MRHTLLACLAAVLLLSSPGAGSAQQPDELKPEDLRPAKLKRFEIEKVSFGFSQTVNRQGNVFGDFKAGAWTPVYVDVIAGTEDLVNGRLTIEASDCDDVKNVYTVPLPPLKKGEQFQATGLVKPSAYDAEILFTIWSGNKRVAERKETPTALDPGNVLFVVLGGGRMGLKRALAQPRPQVVETDDFVVQATETKGRFIGVLSDVRQMPSRWFGYESADVVLMTTGDVNFITKVLEDHQLNKDASRYAALAEWVRRGGRLVLFVGKNYDVVAQLDERQPMLPVRPAGTHQKPNVGWLPMNTTLPATMTFTRFERKAGQESRLIDGNEDKVEQEIKFVGRHGLGKILVIGFDPELDPFTRWKGQTEFWKWYVESEHAPKALTESRGIRTSGPIIGENTNELGSQLQQTLEDFQDVPVISFGWVALFILLYIIVVGPLDYFFLKRVVKRLEFTWITFPAVVLVISVAAYFTAYYVKGNDQRINKVDLVDIDLAGKQAQVFGQTWFTIFSPRIQHYTIGLEPAADTGWVPPDSTSVLMSWLGRPDTSGMGFRRPRSQSLFRRTYEFEPDCSGMKGVPIPVWSTKSFVGSWATTQAVKPLFEADLQTVGAGRSQLTGQLVSRLPVALDDAVLLRWTGTETRVHHLGTLVPDAERSLANVFKDPGGPIQELNSWASRAQQEGEPAKPGAPRTAHPTAAPVLSQLLFHDRLKGVVGGERHNSALRHLDLGWRLSQKEVIVFGRLRRTEKRAEDVTRDPLSPTHLWLGQLPGPGQRRPELSGTLSQETFVRVFIPVRTGTTEP